ncbi:2-hydroxymuconate tautomerase [Dasania marina]|uniref:2-hydroxymuconate tautomerase n=1 Tax=Dasania marina TaxID=471499 RepID=UPI00037719D2|nr:2-hydroxymuconate tautomerase [Dasania marina]|tara:strand:- start:25588 stop:25779 length:192 start_codon:yes stop_codon:yes gene_type:complete
MPVITIEMFEGRSLEQKKALVKEITETMERTCNAKPDTVHIIIEDKKMENWGFKGELVSELTK